GRGMGREMLEFLLGWVVDVGCEAVIAKASPSFRPVMGFMGGLPVETYTEHGFDTIARWIDSDLRKEVGNRGLVGADVELDSASRVGCCVRRF
ncbi:MAG: hypothetical protein GY723_13105, partial [bacterium]|nr:hypothetical protein [bacterium]